LRLALKGDGVALGNLSEIVVDEDGLLSYEGERVVLYIKDVRKDPKTVRESPEENVRFHIFDCTTLRHMRQVGRYDRYVVSSRTDGKFVVDAEDWRSRRSVTLEAKLLVCKHCLNQTNYGDYGCGDKPARDDIWRNFAIKEFLRENQTQFAMLPRYTDSDAPESGYVDGWSAISRKFRASREWRCDSCHVDLSARTHQRLIHTHHANGVRGDNRPSNLQALCVECHCRQFAHSSMRGGFRRDLDALRELKREQGVRF
jgi:hypothetical protein